MKRTPEIILGIIGALGYAFMAALGGFMLWLQGNKDTMEEAMTGTGDPELDLTMEEFDTVIDLLGAGGTMLLASAIAAVVLGIVAMILLKGNKKPVVSGIIFLIVAVGVSITTTGVGILAGIFYLIAGIMCLVRKPKQQLTM
ncbi:DUF4064 domain-containing protein [Planomicrobium sp. YIM 101495]|uniref:DUF4064 domain-containing protein n=1 Tax=Planomicrobium sp. YIM 101495 TaxID=2665160 RepID=UPI0012B8655E|nr:DUF4064 domain-containing protein [Planomicrobium sp. YIM 101495]MTD31941.1 DUF4064 domain-containing protein [Planomicrobium sp. YIM 101495]